MVAAILAVTDFLAPLGRTVARILFCAMVGLGIGAAIVAVFTIGAVFILGVLVILIGSAVVMAVCAMAEALADWVRK